jgi:hypothetical protein
MLPDLFLSFSFLSSADTCDNIGDDGDVFIAGELHEDHTCIR